ncbi:AraC family transcriptional regulator [Paenibacillus sp. 598K]|uniref:helix-turn-helix transcriptional regulator n=1 Tax=Paenibacillus sp. 598K TaxID=1117987 RepID=UPI000FFA9FD8|nr:AraC family transcriptional regulator [Paenibacillus sp. 598K]GBF73820.1 AraC family transcriptional regulator [Paenibacillus sp. 598K]
MDNPLFHHLVPNVFLFVDRKCFPDWTIERRKIGFHDLTFVIGGKARYVINGEAYTVEAGDLLYVPGGSVREAHTFADAPMHAYPFNFHWAGPHNHVSLPFGIVTKKMITKEILTYIRDFKQVWMDKQPFYMIRARALFELILHSLLTNYYMQASSRTDPRVKKVIDYITDHYAEPLQLSDMAELVQLHPVYLGKLFKQHTGSSYKEYVNRIRINSAEMMLLAGDFNVTETATRCGFQDVYYFSNLFKQIKGYPPSMAKKVLEDTKRALVSQYPSERTL